MSLRIREVEPEDLPGLVALNEAALPAVNRVDVRFLERFRGRAAYFRVAEERGHVLGFLLALFPDADYDSRNFLWFRARYERFLYIDRVVVAAGARGRGIGRRLYDDLAAFAEGRVERLACEVNLRPPNRGSLRFHRREGFRPVGTQETGGGAKEVCLMVREPVGSAGRDPEGDRRGG